MSRILAIIALIGLLLSIAVDAAALSGIDVESAVPHVWMIQVGLFVVWVPLVFSTQRQGIDVKQIKKTTPRWLIILGILLSAYFGVGIVQRAQWMFEGNPEIRNGKYVLAGYSGVREITAAQYRAAKIDEFRFSSSGWMEFYFIYFGFARGTILREERDRLTRRAHITFPTKDDEE